MAPKGLLENRLMSAITPVFEQAETFRTLIPGGSWIGSPFMSEGLQHLAGLRWTEKLCNCPAQNS